MNMNQCYNVICKFTNQDTEYGKIVFIKRIAHMLKKVVLVFHDNANTSLKELEEEKTYLSDFGIDLEIISSQRIQDIWSLYVGSTKAAAVKGDIPESVREVLFLCDDPEDFAYLKDKGAYVCGMITPVSDQNISFEGAQYIFSEIDDVDADSFIKAYQRQAGEPWDILETDRLRIRETTVEDVDDLYKIYAEPSMTRYMEGLFEDPADEKRYMKDYIEKVYSLMGFGVWSLVNKEDGKLIGRAGFSIRNGFDEPELGFFIGVPWQRQGFATEACSAIMEFGRNVLGFDKVQTLVKKENEVSIHLCEKLGFKVLDEVEIEEDIYGASYMTQGRVSFGPEKRGRYVRLEWTYK